MLYKEHIIKKSMHASWLLDYHLRRKLKKKASKNSLYNKKNK